MGREGGGKAWDSFVKGISIQTAKHQENNFKKEIHCVVITSIIASRQVRRVSICAFGFWSVFTLGSGTLYWMND